ncbi:MAG TPA: ABC transporter permease [Candidatus Dormibacteraeota bacterium]|jgi:putative ABC transport system permease protein|nr:ABC transporter permease [Candidatus Dormibacteraeota bacterium]
MGGLWPIVFRSLRVRPLRALLTVIAVVLGVAAVTGVDLALPALDDQARTVQMQRAGDSQLDVRAVRAPGLDDAQVARLQLIPGVHRIAPLLQKRVLGRADPRTISGLTVTVVGVQDGSAALRLVHVLDGRLPKPGSTNEVTLDEGLAAALQTTGAPRALIAGDDVRLITGTGSDVFHVVGISAGTSGGTAFTRSAAFVSDAAMRGPFAQGVRTPLVALRLDAGAGVAAVAARVRAVLGGDAITVDPRAVAVQPLEQLRPLLVMVTLLSVLIGAGVVANTLGLSVVERRREIGLLRAAGAGRRQVFALFLAEAAVLAVTGAIAGVLLGILVAGLLVRQLAPSDLAVPAVHLDALPILGAVALGIVMAMAGAFLPARAAARMNPLAALRTGAAGERERTPRSVAVIGVALLVVAAIGLISGAVGAVTTGVLALLLATVFCLPFVVPALLRAIGSAASAATGTAGLAAANLARRRNRTSLTVAGLAVAVSVAVAVSTLTSGALAAGRDWVNHLFIGDVLVRSPVAQPDAVADTVAKASGVRSLTPIRFVTGTVGGQTVGIAAIDPGAYSGTSALDVSGDHGAAVRALSNTAQPAMVVPRQLADLLGWNEGTHLEIATDAGTVGFVVTAVAAHTFPGGDGRESVVVGRATAQHTLGDVAIGFDLLDVSLGGATLAALRDVAASYGMQTLTVATVENAAQAAVDHSVALLSVFAWMAVVVAMLAVVNTLVVNVRQGARDVGLLRAVGLSRRGAHRMVLTEAALLAFTGTVIGAGVGCLLALPLLHASSGPGFSPAFAFPLGAVVASLAAVVAGAVLAVLVPARRLTGQGIVAQIRHA